MQKRKQEIKKKNIRAVFSSPGWWQEQQKSLINQHIPVKTNQWAATVPGFPEADTVAHYGSASAWTEKRDPWGKSQDTLTAVEHIENKNRPHIR